MNLFIKHPQKYLEISLKQTKKLNMLQTNKTFKKEESKNKITKIRNQEKSHTGN
jgi:hypothetical protein